MISALYVQPKGIYKTLGLDCWDEKRDARNYEGPNPVVAHPPCQLWGNLAHVNFKRWGGEHNRPGNDGGCFKAAVWSVRLYGGVLEHPAFTNAWKAHGLARPPKTPGWLQVSDREWVCEVWQSAYGHKARKRTWILYCGDRKPFELNWERQPGTHHIGNYGGKSAIKPTVTKKEASATPPAFAQTLIQLALWTK